MAHLQNEALDEYFVFFSEKYLKDVIIFEGRPVFPLDEYTDRDLIRLIDGGRILKEYKVIKNEKKHTIKVYIKPYSLKEIREVDNLWEYKYGGISEQKPKRS